MEEVIKPDRTDHKYFILTQRIVWAKCRDAYDYTLWNIIKDIAGESGECILSTNDLATLAMMSMGKVKECREYLITAGLLTGELRRDPGYPQAVYHMSIPDLWAENVTFSQMHEKLRDRIAFKQEIERKIKAKELSRDESYKQVELSCGERGTTPGERGLSPGETKKIVKQEKKKKKKKIVAPNGATPPTEPIKVSNEIRKYAETIFREATGLEPLPATTKANTGSNNANWWGPLKTICIIGECDRDRIRALIEGAVRQLTPEYIFTPNSLMKTIPKIKAGLNGSVPHSSTPTRTFADALRDQQKGTP